jgi:hypothetical protein
VLCAGFTLLLGEDTPISSLSGALVRSVTKLASIIFLSLAFSYWIDYLGFIIEGKLATVLITPSLGVPNWSVIYIINTAPSTSFLAPLPGSEEEGEEAPTSTKCQQNINKFSGAVAGEKEDFCKRSLARTIFYFVFSFALFYFIFACIFLSKIQKISFLYSCFYLMLSVLLE